jgi:hypothetical protein
MSLFWSDCGPERLMNEIEICSQKSCSLTILTTEGKKKILKILSPALNGAWNGTNSTFPELFLYIIHENACTRDPFLAFSLKSWFRLLMLHLFVVKVLMKAGIGIWTPLRFVFCLPVARKDWKPRKNLKHGSQSPTRIRTGYPSNMNCASSLTYSAVVFTFD